MNSDKVKRNEYRHYRDKILSGEYTDEERGVIIGIANGVVRFLTHEDNQTLADDFCNHDNFDSMYPLLEIISDEMDIYNWIHHSDEIMGKLIGPALWESYFLMHNTTALDAAHLSGGIDYRMEQQNEHHTC
jgi:hypothetical protein